MHKQRHTDKKGGVLDTATPIYIYPIYPYDLRGGM